VTRSSGGPGLSTLAAVRRAAVLIASAAALAGCGNSRTPVPDVTTPDAPQGARDVKLKGVRFKAPVNWTDLQPQGARAGGIQSKTATMAVWRYPRTEPLPTTRKTLDEVRGLLVGRIKQRDASFAVTSERITRLAGARAIVVVGNATIAGLPFRVRSTHLFKHGTETVVDAYARPEDFDRVDSTVFKPVLSTLRLR
jgi:hypothetical protein